MKRLRPVGHHCTARRSHQGGQSMTEFIVLAVGLVPIFLLIPFIARYQDIEYQTLIASRYVAFDALTRNDSMSTWKAPEQLAGEVQRRFFSNSDAPIKTNDVPADVAADQNAFWRDPKDAPLIKSFNEDIGVSFGAARGSSQEAGLQSASDGTLFKGTAGQLQLRARGVYSANVSVKLANLPEGMLFYEPFDKINLSISRTTAVVFDPWTAKGPSQVMDNISASPLIFPAGSLATIGRYASPFVTAIEYPALLEGPKLGRLDFWNDVVQEDRLSAP